MFSGSSPPQDSGSDLSIRPSSAALADLDRLYAQFSTSCSEASDQELSVEQHRGQEPLPAVERSGQSFSWERLLEARSAASLKVITLSCSHS